MWLLRGRSKTRKTLDWSLNKCKYYNGGWIKRLSRGWSKSLIVRKWLNSFVQFKEVNIVEGYHVSVSSQYYHRVFMHHSPMAVSRTGLLSDQLTFVLVINHLRKVGLTLVVAGLLFSHRFETEDDGFWGRGVGPSFFCLVISALDVA